MHSPNDILVNWIEQNYNTNRDGLLCYTVTKSQYEYFSITYDKTNNTLVIDYYIDFGDGDTRYVLIDLNDYKNGKYYFANYTRENVAKNESSGYINEKTFTSATQLVFETYVGTYWTKESVAETYHEGICHLLGFFEDFLYEHNIELSLKSYGFELFVAPDWHPYQVVENDFAKVKNYIIDNGKYYSDISSYGISLKEDFVDGAYLSWKAYYDITDEMISLTFDLYDPSYDIEYFTSIFMTDFNGIYEWGYKDFMGYSMSGILYANTYNSNTLLGYNYDNIYSSADEKEVRETASIMVNDIAIYLDSFFKKIGVTAEDMGFSNY